MALILLCNLEGAFRSRACILWVASRLVAFSQGYCVYFPAWEIPGHAVCVGHKQSPARRLFSTSLLFCSWMRSKTWPERFAHARTTPSPSSRYTARIMVHYIGYSCWCCRFTEAVRAGATEHGRGVRLSRAAAVSAASRSTNSRGLHFLTILTWLSGNGLYEVTLRRARPVLRWVTVSRA